MNDWGPPAADQAKPQIIQNVYAFGGFAYGAINADVHIHGDGRPVYLLEEHKQPAGVPDAAWVRQPSRLLDARSAIVPFTGREAEVRDLEQWCGDGGESTMAVRWLCGPGGRGKSRLADHLASISAVRGWKAIVARHGSAVSWTSQGSQDARAGDRTGLLVLADYADRWPLRDLTWLFANSLFPNSLRQGVPVRVLLLARSDRVWPEVERVIGDRAATSVMELQEVPDTPGARERVFAAARTRFAELYQRWDAESATLPIPSDLPDAGLTLTLHMAALVAVDALAQGRRPPNDAAGLSAYLLTREREHWARLSENHVAGFVTTPDEMAGVAFVAALTGAMGWEHGAEVLARARLAGEQAAVRSLLADHARCYPPLDPGTVLEPIYPDRLAEDMIALSLPGHDVAGYRPDPWAAAVPAALLAGDEKPAYAPRAMAMLTAAAARWPHVRTTILHPLLASEPELALATDTGPDVALTNPSFVGSQLEILDNQSDHGIRPEEARYFTSAAVQLHKHRLASAPNPHARAKLHLNLATRLAKIGRYEQAVAFSSEAVALYRAIDPEHLLVSAWALADALAGLARDLAGAGRETEAVDASTEALRIRRANAVSPLDDGQLAQLLDSHSRLLWKLGREDKAVEAAKEAVHLYRSHVNSEWVSLVKPGEERSKVQFASALSELGVMLTVMLARRGSRWQVLELSEEAVDIFRGMSPRTVAQHRDVYARILINASDQLHGANRNREACEAAREATEIYRRLARVNPDAHEPNLARALITSANCHDNAHEAVALVEEAIEILQRLDARRPRHFTASLDDARNLARYFAEQARKDQAVQRTVVPASSETTSDPQNSDAILLAGREGSPTEFFEKRVARLVDVWDSKGRPRDEWLATGMAFFLLKCWSWDPYRPRPSLLGSAAVQDYIAACEEANDGARGWDAMLRERILCPGCGDTWRAENIQACAGCAQYTCYQCASMDHAGEFCEIVG